MKKLVCLILAVVMLLAAGSVAFAYAEYGIVVTRNPSSGTWAEGETASFEADAQYYSTMDWTFVDPCGIEHSVQEFCEMVPDITVTGEYSSMLSLGSVSADLDGWAVYCSFHSNIDNAKTSWAFIRVVDQVPVYGVPPYGTSSYGTSPYGTSPYGASPLRNSFQWKL